MLGIQTFPTDPLDVMDLTALTALRDVLARKLGRLNDAIDEELNDAKLGAEGASERALHYAAEADLVRAKINRTRNDIDTLYFKEKLEADAQAKADAAELPHKLITLCEAHLDAADRAQAAASMLGEAMRDMQKTGVAIGRVSGNDNAQRTLRLSAIVTRIRTAFYLDFAAVLEGPTATGLPINMLGYDLPFVGAPVLKMTLRQLEEAVFDNIPIDVFSTREEAEQSRRRRDPSLRTLHVIPRGELYQVVDGVLKGQAARKGGRDEG